MAGPTLGTLLIQRLDAALGTTLSQQTQIVNRATSDPVTHPGQASRLEPVPNSLVRDARENVDRALLNRPGTRIGSPPTDAAAAGRNTGPSVTTSATTSLGLAARIILNLFSGNAATTPPVIGRVPLTGTAPQGASASASATGSSPAGPAQTAQAGAATGAAPKADSTGLLAQNLARALTQSLQQSGLFYESHLKGVVSGQYRLADIRQEPQAQIPAGGARSDTSGTTPTSGQPTQTAAQTQPGQSSTAPGGPAVSGGTPSSASANAQTAQGAITHAAQQSLLTPGVDPATHGMVRQQLEALADQSIHWRGEAWPGAPMDWHVKRHSEHEHHPESSATPDDSWHSELKIRLPRLGDMTLGVRIAGKQVHVTVQADEDTAPLLRQHAGVLHDQMSGRQLELTAITFLESHAESRPDTDDASDPHALP